MCCPHSLTKAGEISFQTTGRIKVCVTSARRCKQTTVPTDCSLTEVTCFYLLSCQTGVVRLGLLSADTAQHKRCVRTDYETEAKRKRKSSRQLARLLHPDSVPQRTPFGELRSPYFVTPPRHVSSTFSLTLPVLLLSISTAWSPLCFPFSQWESSESRR